MISWKRHVDDTIVYFKIDAIEHVNQSLICIMETRHLIMRKKVMKQFPSLISPFLDYEKW